MAKIIYADGKIDETDDISLENLQKIVGGYIEHVVSTNGHDVICNEEGKLNSLPFNQIASELYPMPMCGDYLVGNVVILTKEEMKNF